MYEIEDLFSVFDAKGVVDTHVNKKTKKDEFSSSIAEINKSSSRSNESVEQSIETVKPIHKDNSLHNVINDNDVKIFTVAPVENSNGINTNDEIIDCNKGNIKKISKLAYFLNSYKILM